MACSLEEIKLNSLNEVKTIIKGKAKSIDIKDNEVRIFFGKQFKIKDKTQAFEAAKQKLSAVEKWAEGTFKSKVFAQGWGQINTGNPNYVNIDLTFPKVLEDAYNVKLKTEGYEEALQEFNLKYSEPTQLTLFSENESLDLKKLNADSRLTYPGISGYFETYGDFKNLILSRLTNRSNLGKFFISDEGKESILTNNPDLLGLLNTTNNILGEDVFIIKSTEPGINVKLVEFDNTNLLYVYERRILDMLESSRSEGYNPQFSKELPDDTREEESLDKTAEKIAKLSAAFPNAEVIMDGDMDENTFGSIQYNNGIPTIRLNAKGVKSDTVIHEFGHLFIDSLGGMSNPFIKRGRDLLRGSKIESDVISVYGDELSGEALDKEILTTAVGIEGANLEKMSPFKQWIKIFFNKLKLALGIKGNVALELAQRMLNNEVSSVTRFANLPNYIQYSKVQSEKGPTSLQDRKMNQVINNLLDKVTILKHKYKKSKKNEFKQEIEEILKDLVRAKDTKGIIRYLDEVESLSNQVLNRIENISLDNIDGQLLRNLYTFSGIFDMAAEVEEIVIVSKKELKTDLDKYVEKGLLTISDGVYSISETTTPIEENEINTTLGIFLSLQAKTKTINTVNTNTVSIKKHYKMLSTEFMVQQMKGNVGRIKGRYREMFEKQFPKRTSSQTKEEYKLAKASFIDNKMKEYDADIEADTENYLRDILASAPKDYNNLEAWVVDPKNLDGTIINFVTKVLEEADYLSDRAYLDEEKTAAEILENYKKFKGSTNNMEELYSDFIEKDSKGNPTGYMVGEFLSSSGEFSGTPNPQYNKIREMRVKDSQHPMVQMYDYLTSISAKKDANLPEAYKLGKSIVTLGGDGNVITSVVYKLPTIEKGSIERISEQGLGTFFMEGLKDIYQRDTSYTESGELLVDDNNKIKSEKTTLNAKKVIVDEAGKERQDIPIHFRAGIRNEGQQSYDLTGILLADYHMSENYKQKSAVRHVAEIALDVVSQNSVTQRTGGILKINALSPNQNPLGISGAQSNVYKTLNSIVQQRLYGISSIDLGDVSIKGKDVSINKILNGIMKWTGDTLLIGNTLSAPVNLIQGKVYNFIEGASGGFYSLSNVKNAETEYWKDIKSIVDDGTGKQVVGSKTNLLIERFGAFNGISSMDKKFAHSNRVIRLFDRGIGHGLNNSTEHYIQGTVMYSILDSIKVKNSEGTEVSLHEAYEVKGNKLVTKDGFNIDLEIEAKVSSRIKEVIKQLHGNYDANNLAMIQRHAGGKMAFMLRKWLIPGVQRRWRGVSTFYKKAEDLEDTDIFYSEFLDQRIEGYYTTSMRYLNQVKGDLFKLQLGLVAAKWNEMTDYEKSNVKKTVMEGALITLTMIASTLLAGLAKDADDEEKEMYYRLAYTFRRLQGETTFYLDPRETLKIMSSPAASISMIKNTSDAMALLFTDPLAKYKIGDRKGEYKLKKKIFKLFPVLSQVDRDVVEVYEWLENI